MGGHAQAAESLHCTFSIASLDDNPVYEALSYAWGDPTCVKSVDVEGDDFTITSNLHCALRYLRLPDDERIHCVDALCIIHNQGDVEERSSQVAQMRHVFASAATVVVFLGEAWEGSDIAMNFLEVIITDPTMHLDPSLEPHVNIQGLNFLSEALQSQILAFFALTPIILV